jgi:hypothetical protein
MSSDMIWGFGGLAGRHASRRAISSRAIEYLNRKLNWAAQASIARFLKLIVLL